MQLRTGHPPSWAVAPWPWPHSSPPFAAPHAACVPPPPCACACGRRRPAVRRVRRRGDAALEDGRLNGGRRLESGRANGKELRQRSLADALAGGAAGLHGRAGRRPPSRCAAYHQVSGTCSACIRDDDPSFVPHTFREAFRVVPVPRPGTKFPEPRSV